MSNYHWKMEVLLYLEDIQHQIDLREFDMERVGYSPLSVFLQLIGLFEDMFTANWSLSRYACAPLIYFWHCRSVVYLKVAHL